jgi:hypothetical protein
MAGEEAAGACGNAMAGGAVAGSGGKGTEAQPASIPTMAANPR